MNKENNHRELPRAFNGSAGPRRGRNGRFEPLREVLHPIPSVDEVAEIKAKWARSIPADVLIKAYADKYIEPAYYSDVLIFRYAAKYLSHLSV